MKKVITAIFDKCTGYMDPVVTLTQEEAIRGFRFALIDTTDAICFPPIICFFLRALHPAHPRPRMKKNLHGPPGRIVDARAKCLDNIAKNP